MKSICPILIACLLILSGCSDNSTNQENKTNNGQYVEKNKDGLVEKIGHFNNGNREGIFLYFDKKGKLQAQENYVNNQLHDTQITIHNTGKISTLTTYENGIKNGEYSIYYKTGKIQESGSYQNNQKHGKIVFYYDTGEKHSVYEYKNGEVIGEPQTYSKEKK